MVRTRSIRVLGVLALLAALAPTEAAIAADSAEIAVVVDPADSRDYLAMWGNAVLPGVGPAEVGVGGPATTITGNDDVDARIRGLAEARGYQRQPTPTGDLAAVGRWELQPAAAEAWTEMQEAARAEGVSIAIVSAHRDLDDQRRLFLGRLAGRRSDAAIEATLTLAAPPGYSKHHTGYAVDVAQPGQPRGGFARTAAFRWLSENDFANARAHGWIPSYPEDGENMGPNPEPWEFVWVGTGELACAGPLPVPGAGARADAPFCDVVGPVVTAAVDWLHDGGVVVGCGRGRFCAEAPITRGEAALILWRLHGSPAADHGPFADVTDEQARAASWLHQVGLTGGTGPGTFSPERLLTPHELLLFLVRLAASDLVPAHSLLGPSPGQPALDPVEVGSVVDRGEFAAVLYREFSRRSR